MYYKFQKKGNYYKKDTKKEDFLIGFCILLFILYRGILNLNVKNIIIFIIVISVAIYIAIVQNKRRKEILMNIKTIEDMKKLDWREFEKFIEFVFKQKGFKTKLGKGQNDGGIDLEAEKDGKYYIVQCKKWDKYKIGVVQIREFFGVLKMKGNDIKGIYITTSKLTKEAEQEFYKIRDQVEVWDYSNLEEYVALFKGIEYKKENENEVFLICNKCGGKMILRIASRGEHKGKHFYGCENYPKCKNIINIEKSEVI